MDRKILTAWIFGLGGAVLALAATASLAGEGRDRGVAAGQCVEAPLDQTRIIDSRTLYVDDDHGNAVLLHMAGECLNNRDEAVGLKFYGGERICDPMDVEVTDSVLTMPTPCMVASVEALGKDEAKSYRHGH